MAYTCGMDAIRPQARRAAAPTLLCLLLCSLPLAAATVYRSVDEHGVVSFSDVRPQGEGPVETLHIEAPAPQPDSTGQERLQAMRETTDRMAADRREREKHRAELRQLQARSQSQPQYLTEYLEPPFYTGSYGGYYRRHSYRPGNGPGPGFRPRPEHPDVRPPLRPPQGRDAARDFGGYNNYPASLIRRSYPPAVRRAFSTPRR